jgi:Polysaccharide deacetylase
MEAIPRTQQAMTQPITPPFARLRMAVRTHSLISMLPMVILEPDLMMAQQKRVFPYRLQAHHNSSLYLQASPFLYDFLQANNISATHFMIGIQILAFPDYFTTAFDTLGNDLAVHTWTHPWMTTLSNLDVLAQLGWTMQLMHDSTGGRLPRYWRPPYGDNDNRVLAIAYEVFGLRPILWNQE